MLICVITAMTQKTFSCFIMSWWHIDLKISQFFNRPLRDLCLLCTLFCISWFLVGGALPNISIVCFHPSIFVQKMSQATAKKFDVGILSSSTGSVNPHDISSKNISTPILYSNAHFPLNLNKEKGLPGMAGPCCGMRISVPSTLMRQSFRLPLSFVLSKTILRK